MMEEVRNGAEQICTGKFEFKTELPRVSVSERHTPIHLLAAHGCSKQHSLIEQLIDVWKESSFVIGVGQVS